MQHWEELFLIAKKFQYFLVFSIWLGLITIWKISSSGHWMEGGCVEVVDGDTIILETSQGSKRVRLMYIDAPESKQKSFRKTKYSKDFFRIGRHSTVALKEMIENKTVRVFYRNKDRYGRFLGEVFLGGQSINLRMIRKGQAVIYWFTKFETSYQRSTYMEALNYAQRHRQGIWRVGNFYDPYKWRKKFK